VFVSTISLTRPAETDVAAERRLARKNTFLPLIGVCALVGCALWATGYVLDAKLPAQASQPVREVLWNTRQLDLLGQVIIIFVGVFGIVILFKERRDRAGRSGKEAP
jgi:NADH-quinone oxidoreductase subunit J